MSGEMSDEFDDRCPRPPRAPAPVTLPHVTPIYLSSVYECRDPAQADALLGGREQGYVYTRDGHPNGDQLAAHAADLHGAQRAVVTGSGMGALAAAALALLQHGDHVVVSNQLYGRSQFLFTGELARLGVSATIVDACNLTAVDSACQVRTRLIVVETISNPLLRVADIAGLADVARRHAAALLVDNTFAGPGVCRPLALGADLVMESLTKTMNGHSDVLLGLLCGREKLWQRVPVVISTYGLSAPPFECYLALRGLGTLALRIDRAASNALAAAEFLAGRSEVEAVIYPGLATHPDHALARRQFGDRFGSMVSFTLRGGRAGTDRFVAGAKRIPFCPSLGELATTLSHPETTSHRALPPEVRAALGISGGMIRLSIGIESPQFVADALAEGLAACGG